MDNNNELNNNIEQINNYKEPKGNNVAKVLLAIVIILLLLVTGLVVYKRLVLDKKVDNKGANNKVEENKNISISKELEDKIKEDIEEFPYVSIVRYNISYDELYKTKIAYLVVGGLEINTVPASPNATVKGDVVRSAAKELYNYELTYDKDTDIPFNKLTFNGEANIYAKYNKEKDEYSVEKQGVTGTVLNVNTIINAKYNNGVYTVTFVDGIYNYVRSAKNDCSVVNKSGDNISMKCFSTDTEPVVDIRTLNEMANEYVRNHKDELPQYEITFKIDGNNYSFDNIKKIN